jgi:hypothetical protein
MPNASARVACRVVATPPSDGSTTLTLYADVADRGDILPLSGTFSVEAAPRFTAEGTVVDLGGRSALCKGETVEGTVVVFNEGTASANNVYVDLGLVGLMLNDGSMSRHIGTIPPGGIEQIHFSAVASGENPAVRPALYADEKLAIQLIEPELRLISPARFTVRNSRLVPTTTELIAPMGGQTTVMLSLLNEGDLPADHVRVHLSVSGGGIILSEPTGIVTLHDLREGRRVEHPITVRVDGRYNVTLKATIEDGPELAPLELEVAASTSFRIHSFEADASKARVGEPFDVTLETMNEANTVARGCGVQFEFGPGLSYEPHSLAVNGLSIDDTQFSENARMGFADVEPGAVISIAIQVMPTRPTLNGKRTSLTARVVWETEAFVEQTIDDIMVNPQAVFPKTLEALPFRVWDLTAPARLAPPKQAQLPSGTPPSLNGHAHIPSVEPKPPTTISEPVETSDESHDASVQTAEVKPEYLDLQHEADPFADFTPVFTIKDVVEAAKIDLPEIPEEREPEYPANSGLDVRAAQEQVEVRAAIYTPERRAKVDSILNADFESPLPLFAHIVAIRAFVPDAISAPNPQMEAAYVEASRAFSSLMLIPMLTYKREKVVKVPPSSLEAFAQKAEPFASRLSQIPQSPLRRFESAYNLPSVAACFAALAACGWLAIPADHEERPVVEHYLTKVIDGILRLDNIILHHFVDALGQSIWIDDLDEEFLAMRRFITTERVG